MDTMRALQVDKIRKPMVLRDIPVPEIGDELAVGRALAQLSTQLLRFAETDVQALAEQR